MFDFLKNIVNGTEVNIKEVEKKPPLEKIQLATCVLLLETACSDQIFSAEEKESVVNILQKNFALSRKEAETLIESSEKKRQNSLDIWHFTNTINTHYSREDKLKVIELIWRVVFADGKLDKHEDYLIHKLSKLLNLSHRDLIDAKMKVKKSA